MDIFHFILCFFTYFLYFLLLWRRVYASNKTKFYSSTTPHKSIYYARRVFWKTRKPGLILMFFEVRGHSETNISLKFDPPPSYGECWWDFFRLPLQTNVSFWMTLYYDLWQESENKKFKQILFSKKHFLENHEKRIFKIYFTSKMNFYR